MNMIKRALLAAALVMAPAAAQAQVDSAFAVSSGGTSLFRINVDGTITAYATSDPLLRLRSGSPAGDRFRVDSAGGVVALGMLGIGLIPQTGSGERMMWYPFRAAFRAGGINGTQWDDANLGFYSTAFGYNSNAKGNYSIAAGYQSQTQSSYGVALGYNANSNGTGALSLGYFTTADANYSVAIGYRASTNGKTGAIVLADQSATDSLEASVNNQFSLRAAGGIRLYTNSTRTTGVTMNAGGSSWLVVSDRNRKEDFLGLDGEEVLVRLRSVPVTTWRYVDEEDRSVRHIGPMAQDWHRAFGFSGDDTTINMSDLDGVNLAAVQALDTRTVGQESRIATLERENAELRARLDALERMIQAQATPAPTP
jgi:Head domain of trimeric autotransporter adhesin/Chaperone of endosialidase